MLTCFSHGRHVDARVLHHIQTVFSHISHVCVVRRSLSPTSSLTSFVTDSSDEVRGSYEVLSERSVSIFVIFLAYYRLVTHYILRHSMSFYTLSHRW